MPGYTARFGRYTQAVAVATAEHAMAGSITGKVMLPMRISAVNSVPASGTLYTAASPPYTDGKPRQLSTRQAGASHPALAAQSGISWIRTLMVINGSCGDAVARRIVPGLQIANAAWHRSDDGTPGTW